MNSLAAEGVFKQKPSSFLSNMIACACHIEYQNKLLFLQKADGLWGAKRWGIPCGRTKKNENLIDCMARELKEEISWDIDKKNLIYLDHLYMINTIHYTFHMFYYRAKTNLAITLSDEHVAHKWLDIKQANTFELVPAQKEALAYFCLMKKELYI